MGQVFLIEIYASDTLIRYAEDSSKQSADVVKLAQDIITRLEGIEDAGAEMFPFELIEELKAEYLV